MITIVTWLWGTKYTDRHVQVLKHHVSQKMMNLPEGERWRFLCISDRKRIAGVDCVPMPTRRPGMDREGIRLWMFSKEARGILGEKFLNLDVDVAVLGDITDLCLDPAPFKIWRSDSNGRHGFAYNPTVLLHKENALEKVWKRYGKDPVWELKNAHYAGWTGTEQAIIARHVHHHGPPVWTDEDGILSYRLLRHLNGKEPLGHAPECRILSFHGKADLGSAELQAKEPWLKEYWAC